MATTDAITFHRKRVEAAARERDAPQGRSRRFASTPLTALSDCKFRGSTGLRRPAASIRSKRPWGRKSRYDSSGQGVLAIRRDILKEHGTFRKHFESLCAQCDHAFQAISDAISGRLPPAPQQET